MNSSRLFSVVGIALLATACSSVPRQDPQVAQIDAVHLTPDNVDNPREVRFDVPTSMVMGMTGERVPVTLQARISTREIAARELSNAGYCPNGFTGPDGVFFPNGDRSHSAFIVSCIGG